MERRRLWGGGASIIIRMMVVAVGGYSGGERSNTGNGGGSGGCYNSGTNQLNLAGMGGNHGLVRIYRAEGVTPTMPKLTILNNKWQVQGGVGYLIYKLGPEYRAATPEEVTKAREAATPGGVNDWTASNQVKPRNLPGKINEYGLCIHHLGSMVIKE